MSADYMVMLYDVSFVQDYVRESAAYFDSEEEAIEYAVNLTTDLIDNGIDYLCADVFHAFGMGTDQWCLIGEVSYTLEWENPYESIEYEEVFG